VRTGLVRSIFKGDSVAIFDKFQYPLHKLQIKYFLI